MSTQLKYGKLPGTERFDHIEVDVVEREVNFASEGKGWKFTYVITFFFHGKEVGMIQGSSMRDCLLQGAAKFEEVEVDSDHYAFLESAMCCQPACTEPRIVLRHPIKRFDADGVEYKEDHEEGEVRNFCVKHSKRGTYHKDDNDANYITLDA